MEKASADSGRGVMNGAGRRQRRGMTETQGDEMLQVTEETRKLPAVTYGQRQRLLQTSISSTRIDPTVGRTQ